MKKHAKKIVVLLLAVAMLVPTVAMMFGSAAGTYPVELAFNNLFIFEEWANNENSTTVVYGGEIVGEIESDISNGKFTLIKDVVNDDKQAYNGHGESKTNSVSNTDYYSISVEPNTAYTFSYNLDSVTGGSIAPTLFMFDSNFLCNVMYGAPGANVGANSFMFITPPDVNYLQFRFTFNAETTGEAEISNISLTKCNVVPGIDNLFSLNSWVNSSNNKLEGCTINPNTDGGEIDFIIPTKSGGLTSYDFESKNGYYYIPVNPNTTYVLKYNLVNTAGNDFSEFAPYILRSNGNSVEGYSEGVGATGYGENSCIFTTQSTTTSISLVFNIYNANESSEWNFRIKDIELVEAVEVTGPAAVTPSRVVKNYGSDETYGELPEPEVIPENYVFAGWYTGENGTGMRITKDTPVQPMSLTVYPKFEPDIEGLSVVTAPTKTVYTVGEKIDTTGLVLQVTDTYTVDVSVDTDSDGVLEDSEIKTEERTDTYSITSGYYITPEYADDTPGTQEITVHYGEETATFSITVKESDPGKVIVNGISTDVTIANNEYTFNYSTSAFNRYEVTYKSDSYVSGVATFNDGKTEEFFLEPSDNGTFGSYVDNFLNENTYNQLVKIKFTTLDKENGQFELISLNTVSVADPGDTIYKESPSGKYQMGVSLAYGGVVSELYDVSKEIYARTYSSGSNDITRVDYKDILDDEYGTGTAESQRVNLINTFDRGRYLQQSYYGTGDKPYIGAEYNNAAWPYNPVQGGNAVKEASKIIDYKVTNDYIYVKARPLDWAKWSDEYVDEKERPIYDEISWGDDYITDTYVEAWYYFQGDVIKVTNRKVDYSGLPEASHSQEYPALYLIEPLNHFVYNNVSAQDAWEKETDEVMKTQKDIEYVVPTNSTSKYWNIKNYVTADSLMNIEEPEYWGLVQMYKDKFGITNYEPWVNVNENWAAFTASENPNSFGVGLYTDVTNKFYYGIQPEVYVQEEGDSEGSVGSVTDTTAYRHATTIDPAVELATSYIAPTDTAVFRSYEPTEFTYYLSTGTAAEIRENFATISDAEKERAKPKIAVPETVYLNPTDNTKGQYYVNNVLNKNNYYNIETTTDYINMYLGLYIKDATQFSVEITNVSEKGGDIYVGNPDGSGNYEYSASTSTDIKKFNLTNGFVEFPAGLGLHFKDGEGLQPGETATAKWDITAYYSNNTTEVFTAYTVMYAPHRTVGAVAEARQVNASQHELSSWITGSNGVDHSQRAPLGSFYGDVHDSGYFIEDPIIYYESKPTITGEGGNSHDYIISSDESSLQDGGKNQSDDYSENAYVLQTATDDHDSSRAQSYLGLLTIDESRYTNTDQIPNLRIGWDALRVGGYYKNSLGKYNTYYTVGDETAYTSSDLSAAPSGWTTNSSHTDIAKDDGTGVPHREYLVPSYKISGLDGKYIHAIAQGEADQTVNANQYSTAGTSVLISLTDKSTLRDAVTDGYSSGNDDPEFLEKLEEAATILGTPGASQEDIDRITDDIDDYLDIFYALKYDNLFSAYEYSQHPNSMTVYPNTETVKYENSTITVTNSTITTGEAYTNYDNPLDSNSLDGYYKIDLKPSTEYVFEYNVTTSAGFQAFMFFYKEDGAGDYGITSFNLQINGGTPSPKGTDKPWIGVSGGTGRYTVTFTTGPDIDKVGFRFGNNGNNPNESTFSNIKLVEADKYYANVQYTMTEDVYKEYAYYDNLQTPVRNGYIFNGWFDAEGHEVTNIDTATEHKSIYSKWTILNYTITYDANGGSVSPTSETYTVNDSLTIPTPTRSGYIFQGWNVSIAGGNWVLNGICLPGEVVPAGMYGNVTLTAQWTLAEIPVYFDTILDFGKWDVANATPIDATVSNVTSNGFTLTSDADAGEGYLSSPYFDVDPGKSYKVDIDITGNGWDVYIFFCDKNGTWIDFNDDYTDRYSSNGTGADINNPVFPAPDDESVVKAQIRVDANGSGNAVTFSDIRVYEAGTRAANVDVPKANMTVKYGDTFANLPVPTRNGYDFVGWYDENNNNVTNGATVNYTSAVYLKSKWVVNDSALTADNIAVDFISPVTVAPFENDATLLEAAAESSTTATYTINGFSADGSAASATLNSASGSFSTDGTKVVYTPSKISNAVETVWYHATVTTDAGTANVKAKLNVAPASNVLYEETLFTVTNASGNAWSTVNDNKATKNNEPNDKEAIYGYDEDYNEYVDYSNGTAYSVNVDANNKRSQIMSFDFTGKGFDLISACGYNTGVQIVSLKNNTDNTMVKSYIVDTYYGDTYGTLYQVPIINETGLDYKNYTIQVVASWLPTMSGALNAEVETQSVDGINGMTVNTADAADNAALRKALADVGMEYVLDAEEVEVVWFDDNSVLNGGMGVNTIAEDTVQTASTLTSLLNVVDSVRVYHPLGDENSYYTDGEKNAVYYNVIDSLVNGGENSSITSGESFLAYVSGNANESVISKYDSVGPKDEVYLSESTTAAIAFTIKNYTDFKDSDAKIMLSLRAASGTPKAKICGYSFEVKSNTEMYYDITDYIAENGNGTVTIQNLTEIDGAKTLLAIGSLKITSPDAESAALSADVDLATVRTMMMAPSKDVEPNTPIIPEEPEIPNNPEDPNDPQDPEPPEEPTAECWLIRIFKWVFNTFVKVFDILKGILTF